MTSANSPTGPGRNVIIDCGTNVGNSLFGFIQQYPDYEFYGFEPNVDLHPLIAEKVAKSEHPRVKVFDQAVWTEDGQVDLFLGHHESSTVLLGKRVPARYNQQIDYSAPRPVPAIDFSAWMLREFELGNHIIMKMNIEGAEYPVLTKMVKDGSIDLVSMLYIEWHYDRFDY